MDKKKLKRLVELRQQIIDLIRETEQIAEMYGANGSVFQEIVFKKTKEIPWQERRKHRENYVDSLDKFEKIELVSNESKNKRKQS